MIYYSLMQSTTSGPNPDLCFWDTIEQPKIGSTIPVIGYTTVNYGYYSLRKITSFNNKDSNGMHYSGELVPVKNTLNVFNADGTIKRTSSNYMTFPSTPVDTMDKETLYNTNVLTLWINEENTLVFSDISNVLYPLVEVEE